jgi:hypothetical protein
MQGKDRAREGAKILDEVDVLTVQKGIQKF